MKLTKTQLRSIIEEELTQQINEEELLSEIDFQSIVDFAGPLIKDHGLDSIKGLIKMVQENPEIVQKIVSMFAK